MTTLHGRPIAFVTPAAHIYLSPFPPTNAPYVPPPPQAQPRLVKHIPSQISDSSLYDLFRPFGPMASVRVNQAGFGEGTGVVEFYLEDDARAAEAALHCAEVGGSNIAVQVYQQRRASGNASEFGVNPNATSFVPGGGVVPYPGSQVISCPLCVNNGPYDHSSIPHLALNMDIPISASLLHSFMGRGSRFSSHLCMVRDRLATVG